MASTLRAHSYQSTEITAQPRVVIVVDDIAGMLKSVARLLAHQGIDSRTFALAEALLESDSVQTATCLLLERISVHRLDLDARASQVSGCRAAPVPNRQDRSFMAFVQFTQPDDQPIVINTDRIVTATPLPDGQGTRITFNNGGHQDVRQLIADVLRQLNISA